MEPRKSIAELRSHVAALVEQEAGLLQKAFELSRDESSRASVGGIFAQVQKIQRERSAFRKQIGDLLGSSRMHSPAEVWQPGVYDYRSEVGSKSVRARVVAGPLGLLVHIPGQSRAVRIETLAGTFDGPLASDDSTSYLA
ncbi:hypothetical protein [Ramlibacter albus]|uniref:Uncharacterized protein n=1 Tax=Ramlibacter albus TaxID=2079448 RepID=A0A923S348_9BURK|nr:hypothetical protein [Ramlibacter albus]MBC5766070.1 hypothetical protein [Ramlibacter albus]